MILVFGSTGRTGKSVVENLLAKQLPVRVMVRNKHKAEELFKSELVDIVEGEIDDPVSLSAAFAGIEKVYLLIGNCENQLALEKTIVDEAVKQGVNLLVKQSSLEAIADNDKPIPQLHVASEAYIKQSGLNWVMLRPTFFAQMLLLCARGVSSADILEFPMAMGAVAVTDARDVADVAAHVLTSPGHEGKSYDLTGPELVSFDTIAAIMSAVLERQISYKAQDLADMRAQLDKFVSDKWRINAVCEEIDALATANHGYVTDNIYNLIGRRPRSTADFIKDHARAFLPQ